LIYKTGHCLIYINGSLYKDYATSIVPKFTNITTIKIGRAANGSSYQTNCLMNDFRIYDHALSAKEVEEIAKGLVLHYKLDNNGMGGENVLPNSSGYAGISGWTGTITKGVDTDNHPYLITKRTDTTSTSRKFSYQEITSYVSSWGPGDSFTISGYYRVPSDENYDVQANLFLRWTLTSGTKDTGFYT